MCWKDYRGRVTKGTSLWIGLSAYNKMYFVELGEKKKPRLTWSVTAGYKYKVGKYWNITAAKDDVFIILCSLYSHN